MAFANKNTWFHAVQDGTEDAFHAAYEAAIEKMRASLGGEHGNVIGGQPRAGSNLDLVSTSPTDSNLVVGRFPSSTADEAREAIAAARAAFPAWQATSWSERADLLDRIADRMTERFYELCAVMTFEVGKNRFEASIDVDEGIDFCRSYAKQMREREGFVTEMGVPFPGESCTSHFRPWGVFAVIGPFNFPVAIVAGMCVGAMVTGNTVVVKPAEQAPLSGQLVFECIQEAGTPAGVINLIQGDEVAGQAMVDSDDVDGFVFTGSRAVGMHILQKANAKTPKPVVAEMGGKNSVIVTKNADIDKAVDGVYNAAFGFSGQKCSACSRLYIDPSIKDEFMNRFIMKTMNTVVGHPTDKDSFMGPVLDERSISVYEGAVELARKDGEVLCGGDRLKDPGLENGCYVTPTVVDGLPWDHELFRRELFVPFVAVDTFDGLDDALRKANAIEYGLTAGIFTEDKAEQEAFFAGIQSGVVYANRRRGGSTGAVVDGQSFVGWKNSGTTGRGAGGRNYLLQFMREQSRTVVTE